MCNCGNKRRSLNTTSNTVPNTVQAPQRLLSVTRNSGQSTPANHTNAYVQCRYTGNGNLNVNSASGRRVYRFSPSSRLLTVKAEDVPVLRLYSELQFVT